MRKMSIGKDWLKGRKEWGILISCCGMMISSVGLCTNAYGVFYLSLCEKLHCGSSAVALHATIAGLLIGLLNPAVVSLIKHMSIRKVIGTGAVLSALSFIWMAFAGNLWELYLLAIVRGVGTSCFYMPVATIILGNWFPNRNGISTGIVMSFAGVSGAILSPLLTYLLDHAGLAQTSLLCAALVLATVLPGCLVIDLEPRINLEKTSAIHAEEGKTNLSYFSATFLWFAVMCFLVTAATGLTSYFSKLTEQMGLGAMVGAGMISAAMIGNVCSKLAIGVISDRLGVYPSALMMMGTASLGLLLILVSRGSIVLLYLGAFLFGIIYSVSSVGMSLMARHMYGKERYGTAYAVICAVGCVAAALSLTILGMVSDVTESAYMVIGFVLLLSLTGTGLLCWMKRKDIHR